MGGERLSEIQQAAKRLIAWKKDVFHCDMATVHRDTMTLAKAYLAEHLPDDDEPIDSMWLNTTDWQIFFPGVYQQGFFRVVCESGQWVFVLKSCNVSFGLCDLQTRGQLRQLCRALGLEMKS